MQSLKPDFGEVVCGTIALLLGSIALDRQIGKRRVGVDRPPIRVLVAEQVLLSQITLRK
jgi:hypothetical protein